MRFFTINVFLFVLQTCACLAQENSGVSDDFVSSKGAAPNDSETIRFPVSLYKTATVQSQNLYNGRLYYLYDAKMEEHQFYGDRKWRKGVVYYDGQKFDSILMIYDIVKDELIIKHFNGDHLLLQSEKVSYFQKEGHYFRRMVSGKDINPQMRTAFYDILYEGNLQAMVRRKKQRQEKIVDKQVISFFPVKDAYYIRKNDVYYPVHSKRSVLRLFPDHKRVLRKALRDEQIVFRRNRDQGILTVVSTYDSLNKP